MEIESVEIVVARIDTNVKNIIKRLDKGDEKFDDHEVRLRAVELQNSKYNGADTERKEIKSTVNKTTIAVCAIITAAITIGGFLLTYFRFKG